VRHGPKAYLAPFAAIREAPQSHAAFGRARSRSLPCILTQSPLRRDTAHHLFPRHVQALLQGTIRTLPAYPGLLLRPAGCNDRPARNGCGIRTTVPQ